MTKFVGKFRKNKNYNDDYNYDNKRHRNEHSESKKQLEKIWDDWNVEEEYDNLSPSEKNQ